LTFPHSGTFPKLSSTIDTNMPSRGLLRPRFSNGSGVEKVAAASARSKKSSFITKKQQQQRPQDSNILRGAAIIRQQIQSQWELDDRHDDEFITKKQQQQQQQHHLQKEPSYRLPSSSPEKPLNEDHTHSFSSSDYEHDDHDDEFSDPWASKAHIIKEVDPIVPRVVAAAKNSAALPLEERSSGSVESRVLGTAQTFDSRGDGSQWADGAMMEERRETQQSHRSHPWNRPSKPTTVQRQGPPFFSRTQTSLLDLVDRPEAGDAPKYIIEPLHVPTYDEEEVGYEANNKRGYDFVHRNEDAGEFDDDNEEVFHHSYLPQELQARSSRRLLGDEPFVAPIAVDEEDILMDKLTPPSMQDHEQEQQQQTPTTRTTPTSHPIPNTTAMEVPSPLSRAYKKLLADPAFLHAMAAGHLWQSILGNHIRFPKSWWENAATPPMGIDSNNKDRRGWWYHGRDSTYNPLLHRFVKHRSAPGRLLLHVIVRDAETWIPLQDLVVGCFHPAARFIRETEHADPNHDDCRDLWLAVRKRCDKTTLIDELLSKRQQQQQGSSRSWPTLVGPLGPEQRMTNKNVRAAFGEKPPLETIFVPEPDLYERLAASGGVVSPAMALLREFVLA
jgi:hypothetical protein